MRCAGVLGPTAQPNDALRVLQIPEAEPLIAAQPKPGLRPTTAVACALTKPKAGLIPKSKGSNLDKLKHCGKTRVYLKFGPRKFNCMKTKDFDSKFNQGQEDIMDDLDLSTAHRANQAQKRINVDFPSWLVECLDKETARIGVTRQSIIKVWLVERLKAEAANHLPNSDTTQLPLLTNSTGPAKR